MLVDEFYDAAVSGADAIDTRPGFAAMLERIEGNGVRTIPSSSSVPPRLHLKPLGSRVAS